MANNHPSIGLQRGVRQKYKNNTAKKRVRTTSKECISLSVAFNG